jgi:hypothetical protein
MAASVALLLGVSPKIVAAEKPRDRIAAATWVACSTPAQKAS